MDRENGARTLSKSWARWSRSKLFDCGQSLLPSAEICRDQSETSFANSSRVSELIRLCMRTVRNRTQGFQCVPEEFEHPLLDVLPKLTRILSQQSLIYRSFNFLIKACNGSSE